jgi:hypothetical protein
MQISQKMNSLLSNANQPKNEFFIIKCKSVKKNELYIFECKSTKKIFLKVVNASIAQNYYTSVDL